MKQKRPFIPQDKPKFWVIGVLLGLFGLAFGLVGLVGAWFGISILRWLGVFVMASCVAVFFVCWVGAFVGSVGGKHRNIQAKPWSEQVW